MIVPAALEQQEQDFLDGISRHAVIVRDVWPITGRHVRVSVHQGASLPDKPTHLYLHPDAEMDPTVMATAVALGLTVQLTTKLKRDTLVLSSVRK